jgi:flagellar motor switch protein FliM
MFMGEKFGQDTVWEKHLGRELRQTEIEIEAILNEKMVTLGDVMRLQVGTTMLLDCKPDDEVVIKCGGVELTTARLGRKGDKVAVSLSDPIKRKQREEML